MDFSLLSTDKDFNIRLRLPLPAAAAKELTGDGRCSMDYKAGGQDL
jgi:hypothetical protein